MPSQQLVQEDEHSSPTFVSSQRHDAVVNVLQHPPRRRGAATRRRREEAEKDRVRQVRLAAQDARLAQIPDSVDHDRYHSLVPLDDPALGKYQLQQHIGEVSTAVFKATHTKTNQVVTLRRLKAGTATIEAIRSALQPWKDVLLGHPQAMAPLDAFICNDFSSVGSSVCFVFEYHPLAISLHSLYLTESGPPVPESLLWALLVQLTSLLVSLHRENLPVCVLQPQHIYLVDDHRFCVDSLAVLPVLSTIGTSSALPSNSLSLGAWFDVWGTYPILLHFELEPMADRFEGFRPCGGICRVSIADRAFN